MSDGDEYDRIPPQGVKSYWWLEHPWWVRGAVAGLVFGSVRFVVSWASDDDPDPAGQLIVAAASAVLFATVIGFLIRFQERRVFQADGRTLTRQERITVVRSVHAGRWPDDARLHPSARRLADHTLRLAMTPAVEFAVFGVMLAVSALNVVLDGPGWWLAVAFWAIVGPWSMRRTKRSRAAALAMRDIGESRGATG